MSCAINTRKMEKRKTNKERQRGDAGEDEGLEEEVDEEEGLEEELEEEEGLEEELDEEEGLEDELEEERRGWRRKWMS